MSAGYGVLMENPQKIFLDWAQIHRDACQLAALLRQKGTWNQLIAITRGGLVPAAIIAQQLNIRYIDTVCLQSYGEDTQQGELRFLKAPLVPEGDAILVIDDLIDSGQTYEAVKKLLPQATYGVLYVKEPVPSAVHHYVATMPKSAWIVFPWELDQFLGDGGGVAVSVVPYTLSPNTT